LEKFAVLLDAVVRQTGESGDNPVVLRWPLVNQVVVLQARLFNPLNVSVLVAVVTSSCLLLEANKDAITLGRDNNHLYLCAFAQSQRQDRHEVELS